MKKKKSFYAQLIRIFRIIVLFFLLCSFVLFTWGSVVINRQLKENAEMELMLFSKNCDYVFDSVFRNSLNIRDYIEDNYKNSLRRNIRLNNSGRIVEFIASQCVTMDSVSEIFVFDLKGKVITKDGIYDEELIYDAYYDVNDNSFDKWYGEIESLKGMNTGKINISTILNHSRSEMKAMEYIRYYEVGGQPIIVVYEMPLTSFLKGKYSNGNYGIIMANSELFSNEGLVSDAVKVFDEENEGNHTRFIHNKSLYMMSHYYSNTHTCRYIYIQPYSSYFEYIINYGSIFFGITLFFFIVSFGFMIRSSKQTVEPIKAALKEASFDVPDGQNEIMNILDCLKKNNQEIIEYKGLIEQYNSKMQSVGIERILMNFIHSFEKVDLSDKYKLTFPYDNYFVVIFKINEQTSDNLKEKIEEILKQLCGDSGIYYDVQIGELVASIINCNDESYPELEGKFEILKGTVKDLYDNSLELTLSDKTTLLSEIHEKYNDCLEKINVEEKFKIANQDIFDTHGIGNDSIEILSMCIKFGQRDYALLVFDAILNSQICYSVETKEVKQIFHAILSRILLCHNASVTKLLLNFEKCHKPTEMVDYIRCVIDDISREYVERKINKKILLQLNVIKYINENLGDVKMSVACIADEFDVTPSYLSKQFKSLFDIALLEYIQKARINEAARLLLYSDLLVNEISNKLGFVNANVFIRLFKKFVGTTPGNFRNKS